MKERLLVSVVLPAFNSAKFISEAIRSVLDQTYSNFVLIVVDDGSVDETGEIVRSFGKDVRYIRQINKGQGAARNLGMKESKGDLIAFLDADDRWFKNKLETQVDYFIKHPDIHFVCSDAEEIDELSQKTRSFLAQFGPIPQDEDIFPFLVKTCFVLTSTVMVRRECIDKRNKFNESLRYVEDLDLFSRLCLQYKIAVMPQKLVYRRLHTENISKNHFERFFNRTKIFKKLLSDDIPLNDHERDAVEQSLSYASSKVGGYYWSQYDMKQARDYYMSAIRFKFELVSIDAIAHVLLGYAPVSFLIFLKSIKYKISSLFH